jgi:hypothetical protein
VFEAALNDLASPKNPEHKFYVQNVGPGKEIVVNVKTSVAHRSTESMLCLKGRKRSVEPYPARGVMTGSTSPDSMALTCRGRSVSDEPGRAYKRPRSGAAPDWATSHSHRARRLPFSGPATRRITPCPAVSPPT